MLPTPFRRFYQNLPGIHELIQIRDLLAAWPQRLAALEFLRVVEDRRHADPRFRDPKRLLLYGFQVCSQNQEDGMLHEIFHRIGAGTRVFAEIGVGDGSENNTAFLLSQGWTGFWIDGNPAFAQVAAARRDLADGCLKTAVSFVTKENVSELFASIGVPKEPDLLALDIDQNTYYAWEGLAHFRPRVMVVEYNAALPPDVDWKVAYDPGRVADGTQNFGASLKAFERLGRRLGYSLVGCDLVGVNAFFVRDDLVEDKFAAPFTAENHYEPLRYCLTHRQGHKPSILDRSSGK